MAAAKSKSDEPKQKKSASAKAKSKSSAKKTKAPKGKSKAPKRASKKTQTPSETLKPRVPFTKPTPVEPTTPSPVIDRGQPIPASYGVDRMVAMVRDPEWVFCYWELRGNLLAELAEDRGSDFISGCKWVLRMHKVEEGTALDIEVSAPAGNWYVHVGQEGVYQFELGLLSHDGEFVSLMATQEVETPAGQQSEVYDEEWRLAEDDEKKLKSRLLRELGLDADARQRGVSGFVGASGGRMPSSFLPSSFPQLPGSFMGGSGQMAKGAWVSGVTSGQVGQIGEVGQTGKGLMVGAQVTSGQFAKGQEIGLVGVTSGMGVAGSWMMGEVGKVGIGASGEALKRQELALGEVPTSGEFGVPTSHMGVTTGAGVTSAGVSSAGVSSAGVSSGMPSSPGVQQPKQEDAGWVIGADGRHDLVLIRPTAFGGPNWNFQSNLVEQPKPSAPPEKEAPRCEIKLPRLVTNVHRPRPTWAPLQKQKPITGQGGKGRKAKAKRGRR